VFQDGPALEEAGIPVGHQGEAASGTQVADVDLLVGMPPQGEADAMVRADNDPAKVAAIGGAAHGGLGAEILGWGSNRPRLHWIF
jgi:hypothetical protein